MKRYCKNADLHDREFLYKIIFNFFAGDSKRPAKYNIPKYKRLMAKSTGLKLIEVEAAFRLKDKDMLDLIINKLINTFIEDIDALLNDGKRIHFEAIHHRNKHDQLSNKDRWLCIVSVKQQMYEYIAKGYLEPLFKAKVLPNQFASILDKGQVKGKELLEKWVRKKKYKLHGKLDIVHCFQSLKVDVIYSLLEKDIKNTNLLIFINCLLSYYDGHLEIGTILSAPLCNYAMSYVYRYADSLAYERRGKTYKCLPAQLYYMDDLHFLGNNKKQMKIGINKVAEYLKQYYELDIHEFTILEIKGHPIDALGYMVYFDHTEIRERIYKKIKHYYIKAFNILKRHKYMPVWLAYRICSYYGYIVNSDSEKISKNLHVNYVFSRATMTISKHDKEGKNIYVDENKFY